LWQAATVTSNTLIPPSITDPTPGSASYDFDVPAAVDRVTMRARATPIAPEIAASLVASGDLDPQIAASLPTYSLASTTLEWTSDRGYACLP
jgi:hypothetical protein